MSLPFPFLVSSTEGDTNDAQAGNGQRMELSNTSLHPSLLTSPLDPLSHRPDHHHRTPKDARLLRAAAEAERHGCVCRGHTTYPATMGIRRLCGGAVWDLYTLWRLPDYDSELCIQHTGSGTIHRKSTIICKRRAEEQGTASMIRERRY